MIAAKLMTTEVSTLTMENNMGDALCAMNEQSRRVLPVLDADKRVLGVITARKLMSATLPRYIASGDLKDVRFAPELPRFIERIKELAAKQVSEFIDERFVAVQPEASTIEVATLFLNSDPPVESILVVDQGQRLLGIIAPWDLFNILCNYTEE